MTKVVINLCGIKSKGGVTVVNNYLKQNNTKNLYVIYDNLEFKKYIDNFDSQFITTKRIYHPFLNILLNKNIKEKINSYDYIESFCLISFLGMLIVITLIDIFENDSARRIPVYLRVESLMVLAKSSQGLKV